MKQRVRAGSRNLLLLELVICILFFSVASAVCLQLFAQAHRKSAEARERNIAVNLVSSCAEIVASSKDSEDAKSLLQQEYPALAVSETGEGFSAELPGVFDSDTLIISLTCREQMIACDISVQGASRETVYSLTLFHHVQRGNPHGN